MEPRTLAEDLPDFFEHCAETVRKNPALVRFEHEDFWDRMSHAFSGEFAAPAGVTPGERRAADIRAETFERYAYAARAYPDMAKRFEHDDFWDLVDLAADQLDGAGDASADDLDYGLGEADPAAWAEWVNDADWIEDEHGGAVSFPYDDEE
jgi:hypothetical protein